MNTTGTLKDIQRDYITGKPIISFTVDSIPELDGLKGLLDITAKVHREKRSLNANSFFHVLAGKIAEKVGTTLTHEKNRLIRDYGQYEMIDDLIPTVTVKAQYEDRMLDLEAVHLKTIERHGETIRMAFLRGSHTYNTAEMSRLIDGAVSDAKDLGIETMTPEQLERMKQAWKPMSSTT